MQDYLSDEDLVVKIREGDYELYSEIIERYQVKLSHYLRKFIRDADELEDVLQDVFIKAYRNLYDFDANKRFSPWVYRIAHNEALNLLKKYSREVISLDQEEIDVMDKNIQLDDHIDNKISRERIENGLKQMKDKYREPLILYFFEEKSYEEISDILKIPVSSVGVLIMRAKKILKELLK